jgi:GT2 family glycosyltransferase
MTTSGETSPPRVTVVLVNYNGGDIVLGALDALRTQTFADFRAVVVDNASGDGSPEVIERDYPDVLLIRAGRNLGFAAANNLALDRISPGEFVALLNPDAIPAPDWLAELVAGAERHPSAGGFGSRMYLDAERSVLDGVGDVYHVTGLTWRLGHLGPADGRFLEETEIFSPCAAAALYRTAALEDVGGFEESFFMYLEDVDLGFRMRLRGWASWYIPASEVRHLGSAIVGLRSDFQIYHGHRNLVWTYVQDMPRPLFWLYLPAHVALDLYSLLSLTLQGHGRAIWRAKWDAYRGLGAALARRRRVQARVTARARDVHRLMAKGLPRRHRPRGPRTATV